MRIALLVVSIFISGYSFAGGQDKTSQCLEGLKNDGRLSPIANHVALDGQDTASPQMLADGTRPDARQQHAIAEWIDARSECINFTPTQVSVSLHMNFLGIVPGLYNGQMTFGEFNNKWRALFEETTKAPGKMPDDPHIHHHH
ncbi:MAG: hypothetical protein EPN14_08140 [Gallionella sp.]|nr:MAG: hypothetical protein EPN14_08140 [Gallionella sp.]